MIKSKRGKKSSKNLVLIGSLMTLFIAFSSNAIAQNQYNGEEVFIAADEMPSFPGGEKALQETLYKNLRYPSSAMEKGIEGKVFIKFIITKDGSVANVTVSRSIDQALDQAAVDAIKKLPKFTPGKKDGKPVNVWYSMPIVFKLIK